METLYLKPGHEKRILLGHRWIFSNEIADPLRGIEPGSWVNVVTSKGVYLGSGYVNPRCLIAVRLVDESREIPCADLFARKIELAAQRRRLWYPDSNACRLVYGESDGLPGLIVDRYSDVLVYQISTLGMARYEKIIQEVLAERFQPRALVFRNDTRSRLVEGLSLEKGIAHGRLERPVRAEVNGLEFRVDVLEGQKTGFYLDQRDNSGAFARWVGGKDVLDLFCYDGAWSLVAAGAGAHRVVGVDQSETAVVRARQNATDNGLLNRCEFVRSDVFQYLKQIGRDQFDVIVVDPPAFVKRKSVLREAMKGYTDLNRRALLAIRRGGILCTSSCSYHLQDEYFRQVLLQAAQAAGRRLRLLEWRGQAMDHPVLLAMPETRYLKCLLLEVW